jgi:3-oxoacyl-[acyl-carrier protein] reductase
MGRLEGKVALLTGAGRGIGAQIARRFRDEGAHVVVTDLDEDAAQEVAEELQGVAMKLDVTDSAAVDLTFAAVDARFGRLDVLVNNAGITGLEGRADEANRRTSAMVAQVGEQLSGGEVSTLLDVTVNTTDAEWRRMFAVHVDGTFFCTRAALRVMGPQRSGSIISLGSIMGTTGGAGAPDYSAAKGAVMAFMRSVARELAPVGIRANSIAPGWIDTSFIDPLDPVKPVLAAQTPLGRLGDTDDVAWAAVYLASDEAKFVTGQVLSPNGGWHMSQ